MIGPLVDAEWLMEHASDSNVRLADVRSAGASIINRAAYDAGHIPGAVFFDMEADLAGPGSGRHPLPKADGFAALVGERGLGSQHTIIAYDDAAGSAAARMWWMLRSLGHDRVALLDGGLQAWRSAGGAVTTDEPQWPRAEFDGGEWSGLIEAEEIVAGFGELALLDARSADRFAGRNETLDPIAGHIPTAISTPFAEHIDPHGRFLPAEKLRKMYASFTDRDVVAYCGSGVTACHTLVALELAGVAGAKLYPGSWSDWITDPDRPRADGPEPGEAP